MVGADDVRMRSRSTLLAVALTMLAACGSSGDRGAVGPSGSSDGGDRSQEAATADDTTTSGTDGATSSGGGSLDGADEDATTSGADGAGSSSGGVARDGAAADASSSGGALSGLAWKSGAATSDTGAFATWRGKPLDVEVSWDNRSTWAEIEDADIYGAITAVKSFKGPLELGTAMVPGSAATLASGVTFASCAAGTYDTHFATLGTNLVAEGRGDSFIRLGWEANGNWYAWNAGNAANAQQWILCFQHEVTALRSKAPSVKIDWNMNADTKTPASGNATDLYPGDAYVDVVGVDFYDNWPALDTDALWNSHYMDQASGGGPHGLGAWLAFAKSHGKPLSVPEWGIVNATGNCGCGGDDPIYVTHMHDFFAANAADIAYEAYFNLGNSPGDTTFLVDPATTSPGASAQYKSLF
jgi:Glycosyl hydrolase family 26